MKKHEKKLILTWSKKIHLIDVLEEQLGQFHEQTLREIKKLEAIELYLKESKIDLDKACIWLEKNNWRKSA